ncbi:CDP-glycerol glycerophosphotransferase family protein [Jatrophihabitans fulvus]
MIVVLLGTGGSDAARQRLRRQLSSLPDRARGRVRDLAHAETDGTLAALAGLARRADENGEGLAIVPDDLVVADRRVVDLLDDPRPATRLLITPTGRSDVVHRAGVVTSAGTCRHPLPAASDAGVLLALAASDAAAAAVAWDAAARQVRVHGWDDLEPLSTAVLAVVRAGVRVQAVPAGPFVAGRGLDPRAAADVDEADLVWRQASRGGDGVWSTFALRPVSRRVTRWAVRTGRTPNQVTVTGFLVGLAAAALIATGSPSAVVAGALVLQVALLLDCVDGEIARTTRRYSRVGAWLDLVTDRVKEAAVLAAIGIADPRLWPLALTALLVQLVRHMADYAFADTVLARWRRPEPDRRPFDDTAPSTATSAAPAPQDWVRQAVHMQIGERWLVLSLGSIVGALAAVPAVPVVAYLVTVGFGLAWVLLGWTVRTVRHPRRRDRLDPADGALVAALRDDGPLARGRARRAAAWLLAPLVTAVEGAALLVATDRRALPAAFAWACAVAWHRYDIAYRLRGGRPPVPVVVQRLGGGWAVRTLVVVAAGLTDVSAPVLWIGAAWLALVYVPESLPRTATPTRNLSILRKKLRRTLAVPVTRLLMRLTRARHVALVAGLPDTEENSLVTAAVLAERYRGEVVLVANDPAATRTALDHVAGRLGRDAGRVRVIAKRGAYRTFVRAELVAYTHGLYDSPRPAGRRLHVNLWHGTGPKWNANANFAQRIGAQAHAASSPLWGLSAIEALSLGPDTRLVTGNPRQDVVAAAGPLPADLGGRPLVLWLPTFRTSERAGLVGLREGRPIAPDAVAAFAAAAERHGVTLVAKPHRLDSETFAGVRTLTDADLAAMGVTLYELLGHADGLISDYSSVWLDVLDRPTSVALYVPDLDSYRAARGLNRPDLEVAAGGLFVDAGTADGFFADVAAGRVWRTDARAHCVDRIEYATPAGSRADALLDDLARFAAERGHDLPLTSS